MDLHPHRCLDLLLFLSLYLTVWNQSGVCLSFVYIEDRFYPFFDLVAAASFMDDFLKTTVLAIGTYKNY